MVYCQQLKLIINLRIVLITITDMSLLSNLLQFSSISQSNQPIMMSQTKERSSSLSAYNSLTFEKTKNQGESRKTTIASLFQDSSLQKCRKSLSKSLSKFNMSEQRIDPKVRIIHRLVQQLGRKCRRHYYTFFVTLQTLKKKGMTIKTLNMTKEDQQKAQMSFAKLCQTYQIIFYKRFQKSVKHEIFAQLKQHAKHTKIFDRVFQILEKKHNFISKQNFFRKIKDINENYIKIDILMSSIASAIQGIQRRAQLADSNEQCSESMEFLHEALSLICDYSNKKKQKQRGIDNQIQIKKQVYQTPTKNRYSFSSLDVLESISIVEPLNIKAQHIVQGKCCEANNGEIQNKPSQISTLPKQEKKDSSFSPEYLSFAEKASEVKRYQQSPIKISKQITPINKQEQQLSICKETCADPVWKSYKVRTDFAEKPVQISFQNEKDRKACARIQPDQIKMKQIGDLYDGVEIFMKMRPKQRQGFNESPRASSKGIWNYPQSIVNSIYGLDTIVDKLDRIPDQINFKNIREQRGRMHSLSNAIDDRTQSQIVYGTPMFSQSHVDMKKNSNQKVLIQEQQDFRDVHFGSQAVSFKNSLVCQRQSMKKNYELKEKQSENNANKVHHQVIFNYPNYSENNSDYISSDGFSTYKYQNRKFSEKQEFTVFEHNDKKRSFENYTNLKNTKVNYDDQYKSGKPGSKISSSGTGFKSFINSQLIKNPVNIERRVNFQQKYDINRQRIAQTRQTYVQPRYDANCYKNTYLQSFQNRNSYSAAGSYQRYGENYTTNRIYAGTYIETPTQGRDDNKGDDLNTPTKIKSLHRKAKKIDVNLNSIIPSNDQINRNQPIQRRTNNSKINSTGTKSPIQRKQYSINSELKVRSISYTDGKGIKRQSINSQNYDKTDRPIPMDMDIGNCFVIKNYSPLEQNFQRPVRDIVINDANSRQRDASKESWINNRNAGQCIKLRSRRQSMK